VEAAAMIAPSLFCVLSTNIALATVAWALVVVLQ
jgi:hypothetical protein